ncbi:MAG: LmeA family phospholipid-binding protein [Fimbriimonadaceae bacterium]
MSEQHSRGQNDVSVERLHIELGRMVLPVGLVLDSVRVDAGSARLATDPVSLVLDHPARYQTAISEASVVEFVAPRLPDNLREATLSLLPGEILVTGKFRLLVEIPFRASLALVVVEQRQLRLDVRSIDVLGTGPAQMVQKRLDAINPVFDVADVPFPMTIEEALVDSGVLVLRGELRPPIPG